MAMSPMSDVIQQIRRTVLLRADGELTDGQLLEAYLRRHDEAALAALVRRHGPMVWGVCQRVLRNYHDAEDAFQATFLVLVRKAATLAAPELLAHWLYRVAYQTARNALVIAAKRRARERQVTELPEPTTAAPDVWHDLQPLLDQELNRLPDKYRLPIVLCDLGGKTRKEAARQLGCPEGTVAGRLARARVMLAKRLARRGVVLSGGALAAVLTRNAASAGVPNLVASSTIQAARMFAAGQGAATGAVSVTVTALTEGVLKPMVLTKFKVVLVLFVVAALSAAAGLIYQTQAAEQPPGQRGPGSRKPPSTPQTPTSKKASEGKAEVIKPGQGPADYKALFVKTLGVMAEHFEIIDYANQFDGRIEARSGVRGEGPLRLLRTAAVTIQPRDDGGFAVQLRINLIKEAKPKSPVVGRDTDLERVILRRLSAAKALDHADKQGGRDLEKLQGTWKIVSTVDGGEEVKEVGEWTFQDMKIKTITQRKDKKLWGRIRFQLRSTTQPKEIDVVAEGAGDDDSLVKLGADWEMDRRFFHEQRLQGIYSIEGDTLKICISRNSDERPTTFKEGPLYIRMTLRKANPKDKPTKGDKP